MSHNNFKNILKSKLDSFSQIEDIIELVKANVDYNNKHGKSNQNKKVRLEAAKMANDIIKDLHFNEEDFFLDKELKNNSKKNDN